MTPYTPPSAFRRQVAASVAVFLFVVGCLAVAPVRVQAATSPVEARQQFDLPAGTARPMLRQFAAQAKQEIVFDADLVEGFKTNPVKGELSAREALDQMLAGTGLVASRDKTGAFAVRKETEAERKNGNRAIAQNSDRPSQNADASADKKDGVIQLDTFEVFGKKSLNMDVSRSRDDAQPYVIFDSRDIATSSAGNVEEFLKRNLSMNSVAGTNSQGPSIRGNLSAINLRGMGVAQTLILVDGRRLSGPPGLGSIGQSDINGIPLVAIERIEVLPTTASGIYGGGATGGVVNIILKRQYSATTIDASYDVTVQGDAARSRFSVTSGFAVGKKSHFLIAASYTKGEELLAEDRDFTEAGQRQIFANNPNGQTSPPLGATTNIKSSNGAPLVLKTGQTLPSFFTSVPVGFTGTGAALDQALLANAAQYNFLLPGTSQAAGGGRASLLNSPTAKSVLFTVRHELTPKVALFLDSNYSRNEGRFRTNNFSGTYTLTAAALANPFTQSIVVRTPAFGADGILETTSSSAGIIAGAIFSLPAGWKAEADVAWSRATSSYTSPGFSSGADSAAISSGALNVFRDTSGTGLFAPFLTSPEQNPSHSSSLYNATARFSGKLFSAPGGDAILSVLTEARHDRVGDTTLIASPTLQTFYPSRSQDVYSAYSEIRIPLLSGENRGGGELLELHLAARYDEYHTTGANSFSLSAPTPIRRSTLKSSSTNPTVALRYKPGFGLMLRASFGTGFLPPAVNQLVGDLPLPSSGATLGLRDPQRGNEVVGNFTRLSGGNTSLKPEKSESKSLGLVFEPERIAGLRFSVDWNQIRKEDNIVLLQSVTGGLQGIINNESGFPGRIQRAPAVPGDGFSVGPISLIDAGLINVSASWVEAFDISLGYKVETKILGRWEISANATRTTRFETQNTPNDPVVDNLGLSTANPLRWRGNARLAWSKGPWTAGWQMTYYGEYLQSRTTLITLNQGSNSIPDQAYHDCYVGYTSKAHVGFLPAKSITLRLGASNVFNTKPPFDALNNGRYYSLYGDPRLASVYGSLRLDF